jgi:enoyl-CoA hydratase/carnithine racemase
MNLVRVESDGRVATLTLDRPEARNALSALMCDQIVDALATLEENRDARVLVVRGEGKAFCAGADVADLSGEGGPRFLPSFERMLESVARCRLPVIAAIHGAALGGGLQLATVCDFRIATRDARIGIPSARLGIVVNFENVQRLVLLAGIAGAKEVLLTGRTYSGDEAAAAGLVNRSVETSQLDQEVADLCETLAGAAPLAIQGSKRAIQAVIDYLSAARARDPEAVADVDRLVTEAYASRDLSEGLSALAEKRPPRFEGS